MIWTWNLELGTWNFIEGDGGIDDESEGSYSEGQPEQQLEVVGLAIDEEGKSGRYGHSQIVAQSVIANAFVASRGGQHIDGYGGIGHGDGSEGSSMQGADDGEKE